MEEKGLISKKELLSRYGISYGALYRWKRKGLIPDEWFIKKSSVTGQQTFFPEALVCERIELILSKKEEVLLDELSQTLSGEERKQGAILLDTVFGEKTFRLQDVKGVRIVSACGEIIDITEYITALTDGAHREEKI